MSSDETPNQPSREELEERVVALLMGELDVAAAEKIEAAIEKDPRLKEFHRRMQQTLGFVQEAVAGPEISKAPQALKLSDDRREALFTKLSKAKKAKRQPNNIVKLRRARRRKWVTGLSIAAGLVVLMAIMVAMMGGRIPAVAKLNYRLEADGAVSGMYAMRAGEPEPEEDAEYFDAKTSSAPLSGERRSMESHLSDGAALNVMYEGLSTAQREKVRVLLADTEAAADESALVNSPVAATPAPATQAPTTVNFTDVDALASTVRMRNSRGAGEKSTPAPVALSIVLPEKTEERDARKSRGQFFGRDTVTRWEDRRGLASRDGEELAAQKGPVAARSLRTEAEKKLSADVAQFSPEGENAQRDFSSVAKLNDEIRKAPRFAGTSGNQPGSAGGSGPVPMFGLATGGAQPLGETRQGIVSEPEPKTPPSSFGFAGTRLSGFDEAKGQDGFNRPMSGPSAADFIQPQSVVRESAREEALLFDTESRLDGEKSALGVVGQSIQVPVSTSVASAAPVPTTTFETAGIGGGGGGGIQDQRMYKLNTATTARPKAKLSRLAEITAGDDALAAVTTRGRNRGGQAASQSKDQMWGENQSGQVQSINGVSRLARQDAGQQALPQQQGQAGGQGQMAAGLAGGGFGSNRSSSSRSKFAVDFNRNAGFEAKPELELRERQLTRELAQKRKAIDGVLSKKMAQVKSEPESLREQLVDLQAQMDAAPQGNPIAAPAPLPPAENKQRLLVEQKRLGGVVAGRRSSVRGVQSRANPSDDYGVMPAPGNEVRGELSAKEEAAAPSAGRAPTGFQSGTERFRQNAEAGGTSHYLWAGQAQKSAPKFNHVPTTGIRFSSPQPAAGAREEEENERVVEVSEAWNRETAKALPPPGDSSGPVPSRLTGRGWAFQAGNAGKDADADGLARGKQVEATVEDLFVEVPAPGERFGSKVVSGEKAFAKMDLDDGAVALGGSVKNARPNNSSWMVQTQDETRRYFRQLGDAKAPAQKELAWRQQDSKPSDKSVSNKELLRRLNLDIAGQAPSPNSAEEFLKQSGGEVTRRSQDNKKRLADIARKKRVPALRSDLGRTKGVADSSQQNLKRFSIAGVSLAGGMPTKPQETASPDLVASGKLVPTHAVTNQFTNLISPPTLGAVVANVPSVPRETPPTTVAALLPPSTPSTLTEAEDSEPQPKVRPKKPKTLKPKPEVLTKDNAFSTFSLNVSDVAFKLAAASLKAGKLPDPETVRSEEFLNALDYHDPAPRGTEKLAFAWDRARNPFAHNRDFLRFSIQTAARGRESGQPLNLVVLLDASGSMERSDRLAIVRQMLSVLAGQLKPADRISVVAFARTPWLLVDGMRGGQPKELLDRVINITPQGGTNIEVGLNLAYLIAHRHYLADGNNRVIVLTDGAANLGNVDPEALKAKVEEQRKKNVALDCFGVGWEGYNDDLLETLSRNGDGRYGFINDPAEARDGFANLLAGALQVSAANVKAQIEFNQKRVVAYRQIGYTKHQLKKEQFRDNTVDAAEIGAAESGTAMYSIQVDRNGTGPLATVRVRYKIPATGRYVEEEWELPYDSSSKPLESAKPSMRLASVAASFAEWMAANPHAASVSLRDLERYLTGVPEEFSSDERPKRLRNMLQQARRISGE